MGGISLRTALRRIRDHGNTSSKAYTGVSLPAKPFVRGPSRSDRSAHGYEKGQRGHHARPMAYETRLEHYQMKTQAAPDRPVEEQLKPAQRRRLRKKLNSALAAGKRRQAGTTRYISGLVRHRERAHGRLTVQRQQMRLREQAFAAEKDPRIRQRARSQARSLARRRDKDRHGPR